MKYIKVTNYGTEVNRLSLEKLGLSTKRDNDETIGQFGSGVKFAPIAAIRKGMRWAFVGADSKGEYVLEYIIKDEEGIPCVYYKYDDYEKASSFTADAGVLSWTNDFQIYREIIANAVDEAKVTGNHWDAEVVDIDEIVPVEGEFSVYITATEGILEVHDNFDKYFCVNREPIAQTYFGNIYESIDNVFRVYSKGVLVFSDQKPADDENRTPLSGFYDYEINSLALNEERTVANIWGMNSDIIRIWSGVSDKKIIENIMINIINHELLDHYETKSIAHHQYAYGMSTYNDMWKQVFNEVYPQAVTLSARESTFNVIKTVHSRGYECITIAHEGLLNFLTLRSIPHAIDVFGEDFKYNYEMGYHGYPKLEKAVSIIEDIFNYIDFSKMLGVYEDDVDEESSDRALGLTLYVKDSDGCEKKVILIDKTHIAESDIESIIGTLIHEYDHHSTGVGDGDMEGRMFRSLADSRISNLICELYKLKHGLESI